MFWRLTDVVREFAKSPEANRDLVALARLGTLWAGSSSFPTGLRRLRIGFGWLPNVQSERLPLLWTPSATRFGTGKATSRCNFFQTSFFRKFATSFAYAALFRPFGLRRRECLADAALSLSLFEVCLRNDFLADCLPPRF